MVGFTAGGGIVSLAGVCAGGDLDSSGAADRMCCRELMFATGRAWGRRLVWGWCSSGVRRGPYRRDGACIMSQSSRKRIRRDK